MPLAPVTAKSIADAVQVLVDGGLVGLPTETVYGLAADATNNTAVAKIFAAKGRPHFNPLIAHFASLEAATQVVELPDYAHKIAQELWPGPLTLVAPLKPSTAISALARDGGDTLAVRIPRLSKELQRLLSAFPQGLVAPSANPSGKLSPTTATHVHQGLGDRVDLVLDAGPCMVGVESTILDVSTPHPRLLRHGGIAQEDLERRLGPLSQDLTPERVKAPGQLVSHYAPNAQVRLHKSWSMDHPPHALTLGFGQQTGTLTLSATGDLIEAASNLFAMLADLDARANGRDIWVAPIPAVGLGRAINDRLQRAAA